MTIQEFAERNRLKIVRDKCNDPIIPGRRGQIYPLDDARFGAMFMPPANQSTAVG
jgi:hypothetical protein